MQAFPSKVFITGIGTGVGKTIASAVLVEALKADYWKPIQCGNLESSDTSVVHSLVSTSESKFHTEAYRLKTASSPHYAAKAEGVEIDLHQCILPNTNSNLVIEGAGGLMVPLNSKQLVIDLIAYLKVPVILVARNYLGSINHTLLSVEALKNRNIPVLGILFNGEDFLDNESIIQHFGQIRVLGKIAESKNIDKPFISQQAQNLRQSLSNNFKL